MHNMDTLDVSSNRISGSDPPSLCDLEHLLKLNVSKNQLTGFIPSQFGNLRIVVEIDLSYNHLIGELPQEFGQLQNMFLLFIRNLGLCGNWVGATYHKIHLSERAILGIALGALAILLMILVAAYRQQNPKPFPEGSFDKPVHYSSPKLVILHTNMALHVYDDIMRMTEDLREKYIIGYDASSTVYKCVLKNYRPVAIKRMYSQYPQCLKEFETELETVGSIEHRNLVSLQGYSLSPFGYLLFYDYMENGSLWDLLHELTS